LKLVNGGEQPAADLLKQVDSNEETIRDLAYRLFNLCERKKWGQDALAYNMLVVAWPRLKELSARTQGSNQDSYFRKGEIMPDEIGRVTILAVGVWQYEHLRD